MKQRLAAITLAAAVSLGAAAITPLWMRDVKISPDGSKIAFTYKGDIYSVSASGGKAMRLTALPSREWAPVWSPDGTKIAFASDREGGADIFVMDAGGGEATRLTFNSAFEVPMTFTPDGQYIVFDAQIQDKPSSAMFPSAKLTEVYKVPVNGGQSRQILSTPARSLCFLPDGKSFLYQDVKGLENQWRKHHTSSVTCDLWKFDASSNRHTNLTNRPGEDRNPVLSPDGSTIYFLSERDGGSFNVYEMPLSGGKVHQLSNFSDHPVRFLSGAKDGTLAFSFDGEIYTMKPGSSAPVKVNIDLITDKTSQLRKLRFSSGSTEAEASPDGKQLAFIYRGDLFVTSVDHESTRQISATPQAEYDVTWSPDGKTLYYTSERDGHKTIYSATKGYSEDPNFSNATVITEKPVFKTSDGIERQRPKISPDGKKMLFIEDRSKIRVYDLASGKTTQLTDGSNYPQRDAGFSLEWSPDSRWIVTEVMNNRHEPYADIAIIDAGTGEMINLTNSGYFDLNPHWVMDGNAILLMSERFGMRNHASWGSMSDALLVFLNQEAYDKYRLSEEDYALLKEVEKAQKKSAASTKNDKKKDKKDKKKGNAKEDADASVKLVKIDRKGIEDRIVRLTPTSAGISDAALSADGETLFYVAEAEEGYNLWKIGLRDGDISLVKKFATDGPMRMQSLPDGETIFLIGENIRKFETASSKITPVSYRGEMMLDPAAEREFMLDFVYNEEKERFYTPEMHGVAWKELTDHYRKFLPHIDNNVDFAEMLSEILGELNVSHTGSGAAQRAAVMTTASLGLLYDMEFKGPGMKVVEVLEKGPFDRATTAIVPGSVLKAINNVEFTDSVDASVLLNGIVGKKTLVTFINPDGSNHQEVILPVSPGVQSNLLYERWIKSREAFVDSVSGGRLGYVHLRSMNDMSFRRIYSSLLGRYNNKEGIVIDTRWNGGGRLHEDIEVLFSGKKYFTQVVRGRETCDMPSRRWNKPSIMVQNEANYSNAHGTPWVYNHLGLGKLVGAPVPGTMTSVNWVDLQDPDLYFGIPVVGYRLPDGSYLENTQLNPDILILNDPADIVNGEDAQLRTAVVTLLNDIDNAK